MIALNKRILVISYNSLTATTPNGRTMQSLIQGVSPDNVSLFCVTGVPDANVCKSCYRVTNKEALKSVVIPFSVGGIVGSSEATREFVNSKSLKKKKRSSDYLFRELVWSIGCWKNKKLKQWLKEQNPDCILYMYGDQAFMQNFAVYASKFLNVPLIVYSCEDYCFKNYNYIDRKKITLAFRLYHKMSLTATEKLFKQASALITNSDELSKLYIDKYNIKTVKTIMMASTMPYIENNSVKPVEEISVNYLGALGYYRIQALIEIGDALQSIDKNLYLNVYGKLTDVDLLEKLKNSKGVKYHGFVSYEEVQKVMKSSTLLVEAINIDEYVQKNKRFGFSTKYADSFACGTPFLVYAPNTIIETLFAREHNCAFVASSVEELISVLYTALFDLDARKQQLENAKNVTLKYFNLDSNVDAFNNLVYTAIEKYNIDK